MFTPALWSSNSLTTSVCPLAKQQYPKACYLHLRSSMNFTDNSHWLFVVSTDYIVHRCFHTVGWAMYRACKNCPSKMACMSWVVGRDAEPHSLSYSTPCSLETLIFCACYLTRNTKWLSNCCVGDITARYCCFICFIRLSVFSNCVGFLRDAEV